MGISVKAGRDAEVKAGRDINVNTRKSKKVASVDAEVLAKVIAVIEAAGVEQDQTRVSQGLVGEVEELAGTEDVLEREAGTGRLLDLAKSLGPAVIAALAQLLPKLWG